MEFEPYLERANQENKRFINRSLLKLRKRWWLVFGGALIGLSIAFFSIRYSAKIYSVGAKLMVENSSSGIDPSSLLFGDQLLGSNQEVVNELIIIKSYPILRKTIEDLGQNIHYFRTTSALERVIEIEKEESPFVIVFADSWVNDFSFPETEPMLVEFKKDSYRFNKKHEWVNWGDTIVYADKKMILQLNEDYTSDPNGELEYFFQIASIESTVQHYQEAINASIAEEKSSILSLTMEAELSQREITFMQQMLVNYLNSNLDEKNKGASNTINFINHELTSIKDSLKKIEGQLEVFKSRNQISNLQSEGQRIFEKLLELEEEKAVFQLRQKYLDLVGEYLGEGDGSKLVTPSSFGIEDQSLNSMTEALLKLETERNIMGKDSESEIAVQLNARIKELRKNLTSYIESISSTNQIQLTEVSRRMYIVEQAIEGLPVSEMALMNIERLHKLSESLYLLLLEKKTEAEITKSSNTPDIKIIEDARKLNSRPIKPSKKLFYGGFLLLGIAIPLLWILGSVYLDQTIRTKEEISEHLDIPFMGYIASAAGKSKYAVLDQPKSRLAETFRTLRSNLKFMAKDNGAQVILVSSCFPGEGKTFVSSNLSLSIASAGKKVLVIGADLRKPQLQNDFDLSNDIGLSSLLSGVNTLEEVIKKTEKGVDAIVSGPIPPNPLELLDSPMFFNLLQDARLVYDYIVIDTSPFVLVSDASALFRKADINLLVLRSGVSRRDNLQLIEELVSSSESCRFGVVLNDHDLTNEYGYRYGKGYSQGYYEEE